MKIFNSKFAGIYTVVVLILVGILFVGASIFIIVKDKDTVYEKVDATIVNIEEYYDNNLEEYSHTVYVDYEVDGVKYTNKEYGSYDSSMKIGDTVKGQYDVNTPELIQAEGSENIPYIIGGVGLIVLAVGILKLIKMLMAR